MAVGGALTVGIGIAVWTGIKAGGWQTVHVQGAALTIPYNWRPHAFGKVYVGPGPDRLWADLSVRVPKAASPISSGVRALSEWQVKGPHGWTYFARWHRGHSSDTLSIAVSPGQQNLALDILGSWHTLGSSHQ